MSKRNALAAKQARRADRAQFRLAHATLSLIHAASYESAIGFLVHEATEGQRADIAARAIAVTEAVADTYCVTDDLLRFAISDQITAAIAVDVSGDDDNGENTGELDKALERINRDLSRKRVA